MKYLVNETFEIEIQAGAVFDPEELAKQMESAGVARPMERLVIEEGDNPLMLDGKYIVHYMTKTDLRYCLTQLGIPWEITDTVEILKKKRDRYLARKKKKMKRGKQGGERK